MKIRYNLALSAALACAATLLSPAAMAQSSEEAGFQGYLQLLSARARSEGVSEATITRMTSGLTFNPRVIVLDRQHDDARIEREARGHAGDRRLAHPFAARAG